MTCIKTGARVLFPEYSVILPADLYAVGDCIIVRTGPDWLLNATEFARTDYTHIIHGVSYDNAFSRDDLGIFVIPKDNLGVRSQSVTPLAELMPMKHTPN